MAEPAWQQARLIPTSGINGAQEQERRATSALLAVMSAVKFGRSLTKSLGAHAGDIETFIEVEFDLDGKKVIADGLIRVSRGSRTWSALVEVKTGHNELKTEQLENYLEMARRNGHQALLTISNETAVSRGRASDDSGQAKVEARVLAPLGLERSAVPGRSGEGAPGGGRPDQAWILNELIRYLEHPRSGALEFEDMGGSWVAVPNAVANGTLRPADKAAAEVAGRFDALLRFTALQLGTRLGTETTVVHSRKELNDPASRIQTHLDNMVGQGRMQGSLRIPDTVGPLDIVVDLRARQITCSVNIDAPRDGRATTKVNWLVRQLKNADEKARVECTVMNQRGGGATDLLGRVRDKQELLILDPAKNIWFFTIATNTMGLKAGRGQGTFIDSFISAVDNFYADILQSLKAWAAKPPRMRDQTDAVDLANDQEVAPALVSTALSSQDGPSPADATSAGPATESGSAES